MANQKQQYSQEWHRAQMVRQNTVRVRFEDLNQALREIIGRGSFFDRYGYDNGEVPIRAFRKARTLSKFNLAGGIAITATTNDPAGIMLGGMSPGISLYAAKQIQQKHADLAKEMKRVGIIKAGRIEADYPPDWLNPTTVAETHPIFSVQRNGDIIFRRVTPKEFKLLKMQEKWIGKAGVNLWRWRGTLRKPLAPEVERQKVSERLRGLARRYLPMPQPRPALQPARKTAIPLRMRPRHR